MLVFKRDLSSLDRHAVLKCKAIKTMAIEDPRTVDNPFCGAQQKEVRSLVLAAVDQAQSVQIE